MTVSTGERALLYGALLASIDAQLESIRADIATLHGKVESFSRDMQSLARSDLMQAPLASFAAERADETPRLEALIEAFEQALPEVGTEIDLMSFAPAETGTVGPVSDDFTLICGIDAEAEETLAGFDIVYFRDLAALDSDQAFAIGMVLGDADRVLRESWVAQADILASGGLTAYAQALLRPVPELAPSLFMTELASEPAEAFAPSEADGSEVNQASHEAYLSHVVDAAAALAAVRAKMNSATALAASAPETTSSEIPTRDTRDGYEEAPVRQIDPSDAEVVANLGGPEAAKAGQAPDAEFETLAPGNVDDTETSAAASSRIVDAIAEPASPTAIATDDRPADNVVDFQRHLEVARPRRHYRPRAIAASALLLLAAGVAVGTVRSHWLTFHLTAVAQCSSEVMRGNTSCVDLPASLLKMPLDVAQRLPRA